MDGPVSESVDDKRRSRGLSRRAYLASAGVATATALGGCLGAVDSGPDTVTFGTLTIPAVAEILIARDRGYFEDRNIELEVKRIQSAPKATPQLASGDLDVATGSIGASLFNSVAQDIDIRVVADQTQYWPGQPSANRIWARSAAVPDTDSIYDLPEGLTIGLHGSGNVDSYVWGRILELNDMTWDDVSTTEVLYNNMPVTMAEGQIDACSIPDPLGLQVADQADATQLGYASMVAPRMQIGAYLFGGPFAEERPEVATRWVEAYLEGVREYYELGGFPSEEVATIVSDTFDLPKAAIQASIPSLPHKNGHLNADSVENQQAFYACRGNVDETVPIGDVIDETFLESALDTVGRLDDEAARPDVETIEQWGENALSPYPPVGEQRTPSEFPTDSSC
ncbi:MAG: ABC transporter substrate-binding protein [Halobacteriota archaeon]